MYKGYINKTVFIKAQIAESVEHQTKSLKVVVSSPTLGKKFSFCIFVLSTRS